VLSGQEAIPQFQPTPVQSLQKQAGEEQIRQQKRQFTNGLIEKTRANTPQDIVEKRKVPRLNIDQIEAMTQNDLFDRITESKKDKRSAFTKFFDLLDLPRNVVANIFFRGTASKKANDPNAERGTFGLPKVHFSDVLDEMGFEPGFIRGVVGFVGDVALDPLTYLGGLGGTKLATKSADIAISKRATKLLGRSITSIAEGKGINAAKRIETLTPILERLDRRAGVLRKLGKDSKEIRRDLRSQLLGGGGATKAFKEGKLASTNRHIGILVDKLGKNTPQGRAASEFLKREAIGRGINVSIPFSGGIGKEFVSFSKPVKQLRKLDRAAIEAADADLIARTSGQINRVEKLNNEYNSLVKELSNPISSNPEAGLGDLISNATGLEETTRVGRFGVESPDVLPVNLLEDATRRQEIMKLAEKLKGSPRNAKQIRRRISVLQSQLNSPENLLDRKFLGRQMKQTGARMKQLLARIESGEDELTAIRKAGINLEVDGAPLMFLAEHASPQGLAMGASPSMIFKASKVIRGSNPDNQTRKAIADGILSADRKLERLFNATTSGAFAFRPFIESKRRTAIFEKESSQLFKQFQKSVDAIVKTLPENEQNREKILQFLQAKMEIGSVQQVHDGKAVFALPKNFDITDLESIKQARKLAESNLDQNGNMIWDEVLDTVQEGLENDPELWNSEALNSIADELQSRYNNITEFAVKNKLINGVEGETTELTQFPRRTTEEASKSIRAGQATNAPSQGIRDQQEVNILSNGGFMKHRTTNRYVWTDENGNHFNYYGFQLQNKKIKSQVDAAIESGLVPEGGYSSSVFHVNKLAEKDDAFKTLFNGDAPQKLFAEDPTSALAHHIAEVRKQVIGRDLRDYALTHANAIDNEGISNLVREQIVERVGNQSGKSDIGAFRVIKPVVVKGKTIAEPGQILRRLNDTSPSNPLTKYMTNAKDLLFDDRVANRIEDFTTTFEDTGRTFEALQVLDGANQFWRSYTLFHPSWITMNVVGNTMASVIQGAGPEHTILHARIAKLYLKNNKFLKNGLGESEEYANFLKGTLDLGKGETVNIGDFLSQAEASGVLEPSRFLRGMMNHALSVGEEGRGKLSYLYNNPMLKSWYGMNHHIEQAQRLFSMGVRMNLGDSLEAASRSALLHHYDYGDFSQFENNFMRRLVLFYPWMRRNVPFMTRTLVEKPKIAAAFPKLQSAIETTLDDYEKIPNTHRPTFFTDQLGAQTSDGTGILLPMLTPIQDLAEVGQSLFNNDESSGFKDFLQWATSSVSPFIQAPFELATGREFFTGRPIGNPDFGEQSPAQFVSSNLLRPVREVQKTARIFANDRDTIGTKFEKSISRLLVAGRLQFLDAEKAGRTKAFVLSEDAQSLRNTLNRLRDKTGQIPENNAPEAIRLTALLFDKWREILKIDPNSKFVSKQVKAKLLPELIQSGALQPSQVAP